MEKPYSINEDAISFSTTSVAGTVDYDGTIGAAKLTLNIHSHINGNKKSDVVHAFHAWE